MPSKYTINEKTTFVDANGNVYGLMQPIKLSDWQLDQLPDVHVNPFLQLTSRTDSTPASSAV